MHVAATGFMSSFYFRVKSPAMCTSEDVCPTTESVPVDVLMVMPMFLRSYLICRWMVLHSRQFKVSALLNHFERKSFTFHHENITISHDLHK